MYDRMPRLIDRQSYLIPEHVINGVLHTGLARIEPDFERIDRVVRKIATGIYYATHREPIPGRMTGDWGAAA